MITRKRITFLNIIILLTTIHCVDKTVIHESIKFSYPIEVGNQWTYQDVNASISWTGNDTSYFYDTSIVVIRVDRLDTLPNGKLVHVVTNSYECQRILDSFPSACIDEAYFANNDDGFYYYGGQTTNFLWKKSRINISALQYSIWTSSSIRSIPSKIIAYPLQVGTHWTYIATNNIGDTIITGTRECIGIEKAPTPFGEKECYVVEYNDDRFFRKKDYICDYGIVMSEIFDPTFCDTISILQDIEPSGECFTFYRKVSLLDCNINKN